MDKRHGFISRVLLLFAVNTGAFIDRSSLQTQHCMYNPAGHLDNDILTLRLQMHVTERTLNRARETFKMRHVGEHDNSGQRNLEWTKTSKLDLPHARVDSSSLSTNTVCIPSSGSLSTPNVSQVYDRTSSTQFSCCSDPAWADW